MIWVDKFFNCFSKEIFSNNEKLINYPELGNWKACFPASSPLNLWVWRILVTKQWKSCGGTWRFAAKSSSFLNEHVYATCSFTFIECQRLPFTAAGEHSSPSCCWYMLTATSRRFSAITFKQVGGTFLPRSSGAGN